MTKKAGDLPSTAGLPTLTATNGSADNVWVTFGQSERRPPGYRVPLRDMFDVQMTDLNVLSLIPRNEVARGLLKEWHLREARIATVYIGAGALLHGGTMDGLERLELTFANRPKICPGGPAPWAWNWSNNGLLTEEEFAAVDATLKRLRAAKKRAATKAAKSRNRRK